MKKHGFSVGVVGGGASGTLAAARLLGCLPGGTVYLFERSTQIARGIAYGTDQDCHLLNVRAKAISAFTEDPDHFVNWLRKRGYENSDIGSLFIPRNLFGLYLAEVLEETRLISKAQLKVVYEEALSLSKAHGLLRLGTKSQEILCDHVVLALGNLPPSWPRPLASVAADPRFIAQPWSCHVYAAIGKNDRVLLVGTGLTMVDTVVSLQEQGHTGPIFARSRRALLPTKHAKNASRQVEFEPGERLVSRAIATIRESGDDWREVVDGLRPRTAELWQSLSWNERDRFRRRLQIYWDVHRHRMPEDVASAIFMLVANDRLNISKAQLLGAASTASGISVRLGTPNGIEELDVDWVINCTGPSGDLQAAQLPILESAAKDGLVEYDPLRIGLMVDQIGRTNKKANVWALGPLCRGCRLESTAIPEIRSQAKTIAEEICQTQL